MRTRTGRFVLLALLLAAGVAAALSGWRVSQQIAELDLKQRDLGDRVDRLLVAIDGIATTQRGLSLAPATTQASSLIDQVRSDVEALRPQLRSVEAGRALGAVVGGLSTLSNVDARSQEHLNLGQELMAADLILAEAPPVFEAVSSALRNVRRAEGDAFASARTGTLQRSWFIIGGVGAFWLVGLIVLARLPRPIEPPSLAPALTNSLIAPAPEPEPTTIEPPTHPDLQSAADVCTAMGQITTADALPHLLERATSVLGGSGAVVWMAGGEELFAAAAYGYSQQVMRKLGPLPRSASNATTAAWRSGVVQTVTGDSTDRSAIAAPMLSPDRCIGVFAVEVPVGREEDAATRAVAAMFAAQLAAALAGWPAPSAAAPMTVPPLDQAAQA
jgi:hypothetical protein